MTQRNPAEQFPARISRRLSLGLAGIILAVLLVGGVSLALAVRIYGINRTIDRENGHSLLIGRIHSAFDDIIFELQQMQATGQFNRFADVQALHLELERQLEVFQTYHLDDPAFPREPQDPALIAPLRELAAELQGLTDHLAAAEPSTRRPGPRVLERLDLISHQVPQKAATLSDAHRQRVSRLFEVSQGTMHALVGIYLAFTAAGGVVLYMASRFVNRGIAAPLRGLSEAALRIAEGHLNERVPVRSRSEIGQLSHSFNIMAERLSAHEHELKVSNDRLRQKVQEIQALQDIGAEILSLRELDRSLRLVVEKARELLRCDAAALCMAGPGLVELLLRATSGPPDAFRTERRPARCMSLTEAGADPQKTCPCVRPEYLRAHLKVPLRRGDALTGFLCISAGQAREFNAEDTALLGGLATQAALAIENARLYEEVRTLATVQERERIAREMHDGLAQALALLYIKLQRSHQDAAGGNTVHTEEDLRQMIRIAERAYEEVRQSIFGLRTMVSRGLGLVAGLTEYLHEFSDQSGIAVELVVADRRPVLLPTTSEVQLVRIVQEALANLRKHAEAARAWVRLDRKDAWVQVTIEDDGRGFDPATLTRPDRSHFGLQTMRERAESLGGKLEIDTAPGRGTRVIATLPAEALHG